MVVVGAGVAGLASACELAGRGAEVTVLERGSRLGHGACSWSAGGMLAPWCERAGGERAILDLGRTAPDWWAAHVPATVRAGTLVLAPPRDTAELRQFARRTEGYAWLDAAGVAALEPDLAGRFAQGLHFPGEAHLDPRSALPALAETLVRHGGRISYGVESDPDGLDADAVLDCRGLAGRSALPDLRGVRGEMVLVRSKEIRLSRPVRFLHPRIPFYVVPRGGGLFMIGATTIESDARGPVTARSTMELLGGAYALLPAFGEAEIVELVADVRPALPDNLPRVVREGRQLRINGLYRHGFLLAPALAQEAADIAFSLQTGARP